MGELVLDVGVAPLTLARATTGAPVVRANRSTAPTREASGRLRTHSRSRRRFVTEWDARPRPRTAVRPSQNTEEMGARLAVPSPLVVLTRTTGVPKYRIAGSMRSWWARAVGIRVIVTP